MDTSSISRNRSDYKSNATELCVISHQGKVSVWEICRGNLFEDQGRAYLAGQSAYYDLPKFEAGLAKADAYQYVQFAN